MKGEFKNCILCGSQEKKLLSEIKLATGKVRKLICAGCGLINSDPIINQEKPPKPGNRRVVRNSRVAAKRLKKILNYKTEGKLLYISASYGVFAYFAKRLGFDVLGLNPDENLSTFGREVLETHMITGDLGNTNFPEYYFDIIAAYNSLDKVRNPLDSLIMINKSLKNGGLIFIEIDDVELKDKSPQRITNSNYYFNAETLKWLLFKTGFEILDDKENSTSLVAKKVSSPRDITIPLPENYERLYHKLSNYSSFNYYKTKIPYVKFFEKNKKYLSDLFSGLFAMDTKALVERNFKKYFPGSTEPSSQD